MSKRFSFSAKLIFMSGLISALMILIGIVSYFSERKVEQNYRFVIEKTVPKMELVNEMFLHYRHVRISLVTLALPGLSKSDADKALGNIAEGIESYEQTEDR